MLGGREDCVLHRRGEDLPVRLYYGVVQSSLKTDELESIWKEDDKKRQSRHFTTHPPGENNWQKHVLLKRLFLPPLTYTW